ncbi:WecB/TagA/CpsF family glycosyltransferase, partial [Candidatus Gracilibacteria bacterium]|nr:WecB/TagA/CpsF family glycosyltransferase [Candidatus Gracilibacteria bacterium]
MKIFELTLTKLRYSEFIEEMKQYISHKTPLLQGEGTRLIFTPNPEICLKTLEDKEFLMTLRQANYLTSDGIGLYLAYQINNYLKLQLSPGRGELERGFLWKKAYLESTALGRKIFLFLLLPYFLFNILFRKTYLYEKYGDRICGSDLTNELVNYAQDEVINIAIIDGYFPQDTRKCESQKNFRENLQQVFPTLNFDYYILREDNKTEIFESIKNSEAKISFATLGMKKQELFCLEVRENCSNIRLALGVGSSFDYYTGFQKRAPKIWRDLGFEWLYRIFTSPNKLKR